MRAPGMTWWRLPLFIWAHYATSIIILLGTPVLAITLVLVVLERGFQLGIFDPKLGGDPLLFQHLFWFYSHPAVYIMILPVDGRGQRNRALLLPQAGVRLHLRGHGQHRDRGDRLSGVGAPHVRGRHFALLRAGLFASELPGRGALGDQGLQLDRHHVQGLHYVFTRPCSTRSASSACSPWAD